MSPGQRNPDPPTQELLPGEGQVVLGSGAGPPQAIPPEQLAHLYRLSDPALSELPLEALLDELLMRAVEILRVDTAAILLYDAETAELVATAAKGLEEEVERGVRIPIGRGFAGRIGAGRVPIFIEDVDHADLLNPILRERGIRSMLGVPLIAEGDLLGVLHVGTLVPRMFTDADAVVLQLAAARAAPAIERARLFDVLEREHQAAVGLQRSLLPDRVPMVVGVPMAVRYLPARDEVGGDWYDVLALPGGMVGIAIGDVSGHGVRAAALMAELRSAMRAYALDGHSPAAVVERVDRMLQTVRERGMATAAYAVFDPESGRLRYCVAGHPPPLLVPPEGEPRLLETAPAPPLGSMPYAGYVELELELRGGETVLFYTDGLVERRGEPLRAGLERLRAAAAGTTEPEALCQQVIRTLRPPEAANDDVAMVALHNEPVPERLDLRFPARPENLAEVRRALRRWLRSVGASDEDVLVLTLAVGEASANAVEHAYAPTAATYGLSASLDDGTVRVVVSDAGRWRRPRGQNRGRGLTIMDNAMDDVQVQPAAGGTEIVMLRRLRAGR